MLHSTDRHVTPSTRARFKPGALVIVRDRPLGPGRRFRRFILEAFPGRLGGLAHCAILRALDNGARFTVAQHLLEEV